MRPTDQDELSRRRTTDVFHGGPNVIDLRKFEAPRGWAVAETSSDYDLAADDADLEFLLQPPRDLSERGDVKRRRWTWERVWLRVATLAYAFLFGAAIATGYEPVSIILIGVALACAWVAVER
jgi:hypothetical protein